MKAFIFDTETTGLTESKFLPLERHPHIIELYGAVVDLKARKIKSDIDVLIKPPIPISEEITKITGIDDKMVANASSFSEAAEEIFAIIEAAPNCIAHNMSFDKYMIDTEAKRLGRIIKWPRLLCTVEQSSHIIGKRLRLSELHERLFGEKFEGAHRAKNDVQALIRCACEMYKRGMLS